MNLWLLLTPLLSALAGWFLNSLVGNYVFHSYFNNKKAEILAQISNLAIQHLPLIGIEEKISSPVLIEKAMPMIETHIDEFLNVKLKDEIPMLGMLITSKTTDKIKEVFINQLRQLFPKVMEQIMKGAKDEINPENLIINTLRNSITILEIKTIFSPYIKKFRLWGAVGGFIIGVLNIVLLFLFQ